MICDSGEGMTPKQIEDSYEAFKSIKLGKFEQNNILSTSGIGLGISSSYKLAKAMNGDLKIVSSKKIPNSLIASGT